MNHPLLTTIASLDAALDEVAGVDPIYLTTAEKQQTLLGCSRLEARIAAVKLRVLAAADDIALETGDRSTSHWLARETRDHPGVLRRHAVLADALDHRWPGVAAAFGAGDLNLAQVRVITDALDALPHDLGADLVVKAEALIVSEATTLGPRELRVYGTRLLEYLAPDIAEEADYQRLLAEERRATAATRLTLRSRGDGSTDLTARIPDHAAGRLGAYLDAYTAPRRHHLNGDRQETPFGPLAPAEPDEVAPLPIARQRGEAFLALLENIPTSSLPRHGGTATTVMVTLDYQTLIQDTGTATTSTGHKVTAGQARRLACQAGIIPVVLGAHSEVLDVGRTRRLVTDAIRKALNLRDRGCTEVGCTMPAAFCEAHHVIPWSRGGKTSLAETKLLCSFHHHRAHDPAWETHHHPHGTTTFHRRT